VTRPIRQPLAATIARGPGAGVASAAPGTENLTGPDTSLAANLPGPRAQIG
jgi:hypothetical protein